MESHGKFIGEIEKKLKSTIEGTLTSTIKQAEAEKAKFMAVVNNTKELTIKINNFMQKFDLIKDEMNENARKFESYQSSIETKKLEISTLETEIENISMYEKRHKKLSGEITEDRKRMVTQVEALRNLSKALTDKVKNLEAAGQ
jgi:predicted  nucleic acid-binding Zn-ribbon protein